MKNGLRWTTSLIKKLQEVSWDMWQHCNHTLHHDPHPGFDPEATVPLNNDIIEEWTRGVGNSLQRDRHLFLQHSKRSLLAASTGDKELWLLFVALARELAEELQAQAANNQNLD